MGGVEVKSTAALPQRTVQYDDRRRLLRVGVGAGIVCVRFALLTSNRRRQSQQRASETRVYGADSPWERT